MNKPTRKVMSMVPNKDYLHGYNDCVEEAEVYNSKFLNLFVRVVSTHCTREELTESGLLDEVTDVLLIETRKIVGEGTGGKHRTSGYVEPQTREEKLEAVLRKILDGTTTKVDTPEEVVLRCKAYELLGDLPASFKESMRIAEVSRKCGEARATGYDVDMDKEREAQ